MRVAWRGVWDKWFVPGLVGSGPHSTGERKSCCQPQRSSVKVMPFSIAEQERQARELFARAERRVPVTHSVVRSPPFP
jgi:hypothetical protein